MIGTYLTVASGNYAKSRSQPRVASMGLFTGIFFGIFQVNSFHLGLTEQISQVVGNLISGFVLGDEPPQSSVDLLMTVYIVIGSAGCALLILLTNEQPLNPEPVSFTMFKTNLSRKQKKRLSSKVYSG